MFEVDYILNNHNKNDVKRELTKVIDIGIDFKCQDNFAERRFPSNQIEELLKTPTKGINLEELNGIDISKATIINPMLML